MSELMRDLGRVWKWCARISPWTVAILLLAMGVLGYYAVLGVRYWNAAQHIEVLTAQAEQLTAAQRRAALPVAPATNSPERKLDALQGLFSYSSTDEMVAIASSAARDARVSLVSVSVGEAQPKTQGSVKYQTQPLSLRVQGGVDAIYRYLERLQQMAPSATVTDVRLTSLDGLPLAQAQVLFYRSPEPATPTSKEKKAAK